MAAGNINPTHLKFSFSFKTTTRVSIRHYFDHIRLLRSDYTPVSRLAARSILWSRCRLPGAWPHPACAVQCPAPGRGCFNEAGPGMAGHANNTTVEVWHSPDPNYWDLTLRDLTSGEHQDSGIRWDPSSEEPSDQQVCVPGVTIDAILAKKISFACKFYENEFCSLWLHARSSSQELTAQG